MVFPVLLILKKREKESCTGASLPDLTESFSGSSHEHAFVIGGLVTRPHSAAVSIPETEIRKRTCWDPTLDRSVQEGNGWFEFLPACVSS